MFSASILLLGLSLLQRERKPRSRRVQAAVAAGTGGSERRPQARVYTREALLAQLAARRRNGSPRPALPPGSVKLVLRAGGGPSRPQWGLSEGAWPGLWSPRSSPLAEWPSPAPQSFPGAGSAPPQRRAQPALRQRRGAGAGGPHDKRAGSQFTGGAHATASAAPAAFPQRGSSLGGSWEGQQPPTAAHSGLLPSPGGTLPGDEGRTAFSAASENRTQNRPQNR